MVKVSDDSQLDLDYSDDSSTSCDFKSRKLKAILFGTLAAIVVVVVIVVVAVVVSKNKGSSEIHNGEDSPVSDLPKITFHSNGGSETQEDIHLSKDQRITFTETPQFTRPDHTLIGWCRSPECSTESRVAFPYFMTNSTSMYAHWEVLVKTVTVSFDPNTGFGVMTPIQYDVTQNVDVIPSAFRKSSFKFNGWCADKSCTEKSKVKFIIFLLSGS